MKLYLTQKSEIIFMLHNKWFFFHAVNELIVILQGVIATKIATFWEKATAVFTEADVRFNAISLSST